LVFSSVIFLFGFLPLILVVYLLAPRPLRNAVLLVASLLFYAWGEGAFVALMLASAAMNYGFGRWLDAVRGRPAARLALALAVVANLAVLGWFKYANFLAATLNSLVAGGAAGPIELAPVHLPIGISFFTFQALSYVVDVARDEAPAERNPLNVALYISLFPQLIAGPIVRFHDIAREIVDRRLSLPDFASGVRRFALGLGKKVLVADVMARAADSIFAIPNGELTAGLAWLGALAYTLQIYFDFSGYSDMAIGLGRMFGFHFRENFRHPYASRSVTEFWRRWHISLSTWFRDYLYIPLGGNRRGALRTSANLLVVFLLCGLWHGASFTFVVWGLYHGVFLMLERAFRGRPGRAVPVPLARAGTLLVVVVGWVLFRSETFAGALAFLAAMAGLGTGDGLAWYPAMYLDPIFLLAGVAGLVGSFPTGDAASAWLERAIASTTGRPALARGFARGLVPFAGTASLLFLAAAQISVSTHNPFIYFRF